MHKIWHDTAWDDYMYWQSQDKRTIKKIDDKNRIVFRIVEEGIEIIQCGSHYQDK